jgi:hypothetical protein
MYWTGNEIRRHRRRGAGAVALILTATLPAAAAQDWGNEGGTELTPEVVRAADAGLEYLARNQEPSGGWIGDVGYKLNQDYKVLQNDVPHVGVTALAGMAFLAGGHLPDRGKYGPVLDKAISFLLGQVNDLGFITYKQTRMYSHAFATLFLAEVYGMTSRPDVRIKLQEAVNLIVASQNKKGSWRYEPFALESDMSITVCQLMALRAARNTGIKVPASTIDRAVEYVLASLVKEGDEIDASYYYHSGYYHSEPGAFRYQNTHDSRSSFALTSAGVTSLYHAARYDQSMLRRSLKYLEDTQRMVSTNWFSHYFYYYGHYYAVQAMFITGKDYWERYWRTVSRELVARQNSDGSWDNRMGPGPNFGTAVACIVLQTPNRYLPILQR